MTATDVALAVEGFDPAAPYRLLIIEVRLEADAVISLVLRAPDGRALPPWSAGAHLDIKLPSGLVRQYSLCGDERDRNTYRIAVLRENTGRGGSAELHGAALVGAQLEVRGPRNRFALGESPNYLFVAGGIGITPILSMIVSLGDTRPWSLYYGGRSRSSMAFLDEALAVGGGRVHVVPEDEAGLLDLSSIVASAGPSTAIYCCGPPGLLAAAEAAVARRTPSTSLHVERFAPNLVPSLEATAQATANLESAFTVELRRSGRTIEVPPNRSMLEAVRGVVPDVPSSCEEGYCGSCEIRVLGGIPDHRDEVLSPAERAANCTVMPCVSRCTSGPLVLDL